MCDNVGRVALNVYWAGIRQLIDNGAQLCELRIRNPGSMTKYNWTGELPECVEVLDGKS